MIQEKEIQSIFQNQLSSIRNESLRSKVIQTWVLACKKGNWGSVEEIKGLPFTLLTNTHGVNFIEHTIAVTQGAVALANAQTDTYSQLPYEIDFDRLYAGGLLHDVGKLLEIEPDGSGGY